MYPHCGGLGARTLLACAILFTAALPGVCASSSAFATLVDSVRLPAADGVTIGHGRIVRRQLTPAELSTPIGFSVSLNMRDLQGLQAKLATGQRFTDAEMESAYLPLRADYDRVQAWLVSQGFTVTMTDRSHTSVFVQGTVAQVSQALGVAFARVAVSDGEYTSAIEAPRLPADLAPVVLSVDGLQPEFRLRHIRSRALAPEDLYAGHVYITPDNIQSAYNFPKSATGAGQTIAIVGEGPVATSDLTEFWNTVGSSQTVANFTTINVSGGSGTSQSGATDEGDLDIEWAGALAPGAAIRYYVNDTNIFNCFQQIHNDLPTYPGMRVISVSYGDTEGDQTGIHSLSQTFAQFAAAGVTVVASSGDSGSNPTPGSGGGGYLSSNPLAVNYPASDPNVTGVGGTDVQFESTWVYAGELVWNDIAGSMSATGGGVSNAFTKPSWQTGGSVLAAQSDRCVPDVSAMSNADLNDVIPAPNYGPVDATDQGVLTFNGGTAGGRVGTSLSCPIWGAVAALINQARAANGAASIGLMNPSLYPLQGTSAFNDITSGNNGAYSAGPGYDLCTGLGSPNVANLISVLSGGSQANQRLLDISTRAQVQTGQNILIAGFVIGGTGASKSVLVRAIGPALSAFGVSGVLGQPTVSVFDKGGSIIATNTGWGNLPTGGSSTVAATFRQATSADMNSVGAFALTQNSADSAIVLTLPPDSYSVQVTGVGNTTGVALVEVYDLSTSAPQTLVNISSRCFVGTGANVAISGIVIGGNTSAKLLIRGVGPALGNLGIAQAIDAPSITLIDSKDTNIVSDTGWGNNLTVGTSSTAGSYRLATAADMSSVGAFALVPGSKDSAMVVTLPPNSYTIQLSSADSTTGTGLIEVYQLSD